ncbi:MAG: hypothetical protein PUC00_03585 [Clostridiales bacterium]|nr:hypothetical protein [Clostridiales bacterium]
MRRAALELLLTRPAQVARMCGLDRLTDELHGAWMQEMLLGTEDMTLLAHRGSYKTTCLSFAMAAMLLSFPHRNIIFMRKTDEDVTEVIRQVKLLLRTDAMRHLSQLIYGAPVEVQRTDMFAVQLSCYAALRGATQLIGLGTGGSLTGKHADIVITDDIVNLHDRTSAAERSRIRAVYQELQNIRNPGGRILNTGTPWHPEDAISLMPNIRRCDCYHSGLLREEDILQLQRAMSPSLFAANYELRHIATEGALFGSCPPVNGDAALLRDGVAHVDAAYGGDDFTALTCGRIVGDQLLLYGRLWQKHVDAVMAEIIAACDQLMCGPILCETNGDKGYVARELRAGGAAVRPYAETMNKHIKISTLLRKWWPRVVFVQGTDRAYIDQILDYTASAAHDDAPDSAACLIRALERSRR